MKSRFFVATALLFAFIKPATADDYGCKVLLCLANPSGPMAVSMCVPPITKLYDDLAHGRAFPSCDMAAGPTGRSYAVQNTSYYDPCPTGTSALDAGLYAVQDGGTTPSLGIGTGDDLAPSSFDGSYTPLTQKTCVGTKTGDTPIGIGSGDGYMAVDAGVYDRVVLLDPATTARVIDVYIDDKLYRRVRW